MAGKCTNMFLAHHAVCCQVNHMAHQVQMHIGLKPTAYAIVQRQFLRQHQQLALLLFLLCKMHNSIGHCT